jgi:hypothetical protein
MSCFTEVVKRVVGADQGCPRDRPGEQHQRSGSGVITGQLYRVQRLARAALRLGAPPPCPNPQARVGVAVMLALHPASRRRRGVRDRSEAARRVGLTETAARRKQPYYLTVADGWRACLRRPLGRAARP